MKNIAIFASGNGSNFQKINDEIKKGNIKANLSLLVCDKPNAFVLDRAQKEGINTLVFNPKEYDSKELYEEIILSKLKDNNIDLIVLAGYMRLIGKTILNSYEGKIINIHPSLLPSFKGKDAIEQAYNYGVKVMGVTVHYVDSGMDTGEIIAQDSFKIEDYWDIDEIEKRIHEIEYKLYPEVISNLIEEGTV